MFTFIPGSRSATGALYEKVRLRGLVDLGPPGFAEPCAQGVKTAPQRRKAGKRLDIAKRSIFGLIYRFSVISTIILVGFFIKFDHTILKFIWKCRGHRITKPIFKRKNKVVGLILPNMKSYSKAMVIKTVWSWHRERYTYWWNRIESPQINTYIYG
ncbi:LINE-1 retrotransposable element ORF2 protein [Sciurus carolinensis]|uniref:LINE-1 retrotransposable element ORF2 protein n=1 Tax=Sciurus carolinensis TaxID=30640 RepID=A0AA41MPN0_SCICA|nr:LINE-1 retrotransposable element ORF2 protein [Sciurus carolinensis]